MYNDVGLVIMLFCVQIKTKLKSKTCI